MSRRVGVRYACVAAAMVATVGAGAWFVWRRIDQNRAPLKPSIQKVVAASHPTTAPTTRPAPRDYMGVVLAMVPDFPTTQPLAVPMDDLHDAAAIVLRDPVYLDSAGELWITRSDGVPLAEHLSKPGDESSHVVRQQVDFVLYLPDDKGVWRANVVSSENGLVQIISRDGRIDLQTPHDYDWTRAFQWNEAIVVPAQRGVGIIRPRSRPIEIYHEFAMHTDGRASPTTSPTLPQILLDWRGVLAWIPPAQDHPGSIGAVRFVDNKWTTLDSARGWPDRIVHLVPLLDGCVLQLHEDEGSSTLVAMAVLDPAEVDAKKVEALVAQLSDLNPKSREAAHDELTRYGSQIWPMLEKLRDSQPPEGRQRITRLLRAKERPTLGRTMPRPGRMRVVSRLGTGGVLLFAENGVELPAVDGPAVPVIPAWITIMPGRPIGLAWDALVSDLDPEKADVYCIGDEWIVSDDLRGPQRFAGNHLERILRKPFREFRVPVGIDRRGRWLFRKTPGAVETLVLDPTLPDPSPRLPVWHYPVEAGAVGWTRDGWPVIKSGGAWVLDENGTRKLDESREQMLTELPAATNPATTRADDPILIDADGGRFYDGRDSLRYISKEGVETNWPLPAIARGEGDVHLIRAADRLFLFNQPGRVLRIRQLPGGSEPFAVDATFVRNIPNVDHVTRLWMDPAGRIVMAYEGNRLSILFPTGRIPPEISRRMLASDLKANEEE
ncbi:MAG: hypothetical protein ACREJC_16100 [Tepidisphaeraceae bacterium]